VLSFNTNILSIIEFGLLGFNTLFGLFGLFVLKGLFILYILNGLVIYDASNKYKYLEFTLFGLYFIDK